MTIREMIQANPGLFYSQSWYEDEAFMDTPLPENHRQTLPDSRSHVGIPPGMVLWYTTDVVPAVELVNLFVMYPKDPIWQGWFWTTDMDQYGQRIFVGCNGDGLEIHRHLKITSRWAVPAWS